MKIGRFFILVAVVLSSSPALLYAAPPNGSASSQPASVSYQIGGQGADYRNWMKIVRATDASGNLIYKTNNAYVELATGLNHLVNDQWVDSKAQIAILPDGTAAATNGQHQAYFPGDIAQGVIELVTPDGEQLQSQPIGLSYDDGSNSVMFALLTNSVGELAASNQVIYPDAFEGASASLLYTYTKAGFEQDVLVQGQLPAPASYGLNPETTRLQVLTEFFDTSNPVQTALPVNARDGLSDTTLTFGTMKMVQGKAFSIGSSGDNSAQNVQSQLASDAARVPTYKSWLQLNGRKFLLEQVPYERIAPQLAQLPALAAANTAVKGILNKVSTQRLLPPVQMVQAGTNRMQLAKADLPKHCVALDYVELDSDQTNYTFQGDTTYYISGYFNLYGTTVFEGGTVIKYGFDGEIEVDGPYVCQTAPYRPAVFTSMNDNSVGEAISGSSGTPGSSDSTYDLYIASTGGKLENMRFSYTMRGVSQLGIQVWDSQFAYCSGFAIDELGSTAVVQNVLFENCSWLVVQQDNGDPVTLIGDNITVDQCNWLADSGSSIYLTNSLFTAMGEPVPPSTTNNPTVVVLASNAGIYQAVAGGNYYLPTNSPYCDAGTTNIDSSVLADIQTKTTWPPILYSNASFSSDTIFSPQAQRDTNASPDLGYHYDPLDYVFSDCDASGNLTFTAGTAVGWFPNCSSSIVDDYYGIHVEDSETVSFNGLPAQPVYFVRCNTVQEQDFSTAPLPYWSYENTVVNLNGIESGAGDPSSAPALNASFLRCLAMPADGGDPTYHFSGNLNVNAACGEFWNGNLGTEESDDFAWFTLDNCLFDGCPVEVQGPKVDDNSMGFTMQNCTMHNGSFYLNHYTYDEGEQAATWLVTIGDSTFDSVSVVIDASTGDTNNIYFDYNALLTGELEFDPRRTSAGPHDIVTNQFDWQSGPLGGFYLPPDSPLIDAGNEPAGSIYFGMYEGFNMGQFTTQTNQVLDSSNVDIGYHYWAQVDGPQLTGQCMGVILLSWSLDAAVQSMVNEGLLNINDFNIYRSTVPGPFTAADLIYTTGDASQTNYVDNTVVPGVTYYYAVTFDYYDIYNYATLESPFSNVITNSACLPPPSGTNGVDVVFILDNTFSMWLQYNDEEMDAFQDAITNAIPYFEESSGTNCRFALVTPDTDEDTNPATGANDGSGHDMVVVRIGFTNNITAFEAAVMDPNMDGIGGNYAESTDECLDTVVNALAAAGRQNPADCTPPSPVLQLGDFPGFRTNALKLVVMITDGPPSAFCDAITADSGCYTDMYDTNYEAYAQLYSLEAETNHIKINAIQPWHPDVCYDGLDAQTVMQNYYATNTCGWYSQLDATPSSGEVEAAILNMFYTPDVCGE